MLSERQVFARCFALLNMTSKNVVLSETKNLRDLSHSFKMTRRADLSSGNYFTFFMTFEMSSSLTM